MLEGAVPVPLDETGWCFRCSRTTRHARQRRSSGAHARAARH